MSTTASPTAKQRWRVAMRALYSSVTSSSGLISRAGLCRGRWRCGDRAHVRLAALRDGVELHCALRAGLVLPPLLPVRRAAEARGVGLPGVVVAGAGGAEREGLLADLRVVVPL